jgi:uridine phosphorylase
MSFQSKTLYRPDGTIFHLGVRKEQICSDVILAETAAQATALAALLDRPEKQGENREYVTFRGFYQEHPMALMSTGLGSMPMAIAVEELHKLGAARLLFLQEVENLCTDRGADAVWLADCAVRHKGAGEEYVPLSYPAAADPRLSMAFLDRGFQPVMADSVEVPDLADRDEALSLGATFVDRGTSTLYVLASILGMQAVSLAVEKGRPGGMEALFRLACQVLSEQER